MIDYKKIGVVVILCAGAFAIGRYSANTDKSLVANTEITKNVDVIKNEKKTITEVKEKDGTVKTITVIDSTTNKKSNTEIKDSIAIKEKNDTMNKITLMYGYDFNTDKNVYGLAYNRKLLGPFDVGVFGLTNKTYGVSLGMEF